jgi:uncharacterized protein YecT (DUF1311 family)
MKTFLILFYISCSIYGQTQLELNKNECQKYKKADSSLNVVFKKVISEYSTDTLFITKFKIAQKKWILLRDADLAAIYPDTSRMAYGSVNPMCKCMFLTVWTEERIKYLRQWIDKKEEGDVCTGSIGSE